MGGVGVSGYWLAIDTATDIASVAVGRRAGAGPVQAETGAHARGARRHATEILRLLGFALAGAGVRPPRRSGPLLGDGPGGFPGAGGRSPPCSRGRGPGASPRFPSPPSPSMDALPKRRSSGRPVTGARYRIRPARAADIAAVAAIEQEVFADPWSANDFQECVAGGVLFSVATACAAVAGYVVAHHAADEGEILNLAVTPLHRRRGLGRALVRHVLGRLARRMVKIVFLEARQSNTAARRLYESLGVVRVGRRPGYYRRPLEDAVILRATLAQVAYL